jgi:hypothetical protein
MTQFAYRRKYARMQEYNCSLYTCHAPDSVRYRHFAGAWIYKHLEGCGTQAGTDSGDSIGQLSIKALVLHIFSSELSSRAAAAGAGAGEAAAAHGGASISNNRCPSTQQHQDAAGSRKPPACPASVEVALVRDALTSALADLKRQTSGTFGLSKVG